MVAPFHIFRVEVGGEVFWLGEADELQTAKLGVNRLVSNSPGEYWIVSLNTGHRISIKPELNSDELRVKEEYQKLLMREIELLKTQISKLRREQ